MMERNERLEKQRVLRLLYSTMPNSELSEMLGLPAGHIQVMAFRMGLKKDPDYISMMNRANGRKGLVARRVAHHD